MSVIGMRARTGSATSPAIAPLRAPSLTRIGLEGAGQEIHVVIVDTRDDPDDPDALVSRLLSQCHRAEATEIDQVAEPLKHVTCNRCKIILRGEAFRGRK